MFKTNSPHFAGKPYSRRIAIVNDCMNYSFHAVTRVAHKSYAKITGIMISIAVLLLRVTANAQDGNAGITEATMRVRSYFATGTGLMYAIGSVVGLVGAVKVFQKWNSGDQDTGKVAAAWFGSCVFLVIVATVLRSFFGL